MDDPVPDFFYAACEARFPLLVEPHRQALRLFNGFFEGCPDLLVDVYGRTLVLYNYAAEPAALDPLLQAAQDWLLARLPWVQAVLVKTRHAADEASRRGVLRLGAAPDRQVDEYGVAYALDLQMNQDAGLYLDTRLLRQWLRHNLSGRTVLNTFAYTGSLGVAALAGGARQVVQTDLSRRFLELGRASYRLNGLSAAAGDFIAGDFFAVAARLRRQGALFDCVILDAPLFAVTRGGTVDLLQRFDRLLNKARPLVAHNGYLVAINNAVFLSGADYQGALERLCAGGYMQIETFLPVPEDITGYAHTRCLAPPVDPAPFNHATKIAVLRLQRKDEAGAPAKNG